MHISRCSLQRPSEDDGGVDVQNTDARTEPGRAVKRAVDWLICQGCGWMLYAKRLIRNLSLAGPVRIPGEGRRQDDQHVAVYPAWTGQRGSSASADAFDCQKGNDDVLRKGRTPNQPAPSSKTHG